MPTKSHVSKWGDGLAIHIPESVAEEWGVQEGSAIEIVTQGDRVILRKRPYDLDEMLSQINPGNLHTEQDTGPPQGKEQW